MTFDESQNVRARSRSFYPMRVVCEAVVDPLWYPLSTATSHVSLIGHTPVDGPGGFYDRREYLADPLQPWKIANFAHWRERKKLRHQFFLIRS